MDISISTDAYPVYIVATKFRQSTAGAKGGPSPKDKDADIPRSKIVIIRPIWNCLRINTYLH